jgi:hypothetical protein
LADGCVDEAAGFDKIAGSDFGRRSRPERSEGESHGRDEPSHPRADIPTAPRGRREVGRRVCGRSRRVRQNRRERFWTAEPARARASRTRRSGPSSRQTRQPPSGRFFVCGGAA